jgi:SAM-dependent methyltransferase
VRGKSLLHLQCHFGLDTMSWARLGATVTGLDFSGEAIKLARSLSDELKLPARFTCADVYDARATVGDQFDVVFTSYGAITWLPDIRRWAQIIAQSLKPGGFFYIADEHPFASIFNHEDDAADRLALHPLGTTDINAIGRIANEPVVRRYLFDDQPVTPEFIRAVLAQSVRDFEERRCV